MLLMKKRPWIFQPDVSPQDLPEDFEQREAKYIVSKLTKQDEEVVELEIKQTMETEIGPMLAYMPQKVQATVRKTFLLKTIMP